MYLLNLSYPHHCHSYTPATCGKVDTHSAPGPACTQAPFSMMTAFRRCRLPNHHTPPHARFVDRHQPSYHPAGTAPAVTGGRIPAGWVHRRLFPGLSVGVLLCETNLVTRELVLVPDLRTAAPNCLMTAAAPLPLRRTHLPVP